jgi:hypothetical protein
MKHKKFFAHTLTVLSLSLGAATAQAQQEPPRGQDVGRLAGNCAIGPFGQVSKAGPYNRLCAEMSDAEKCLAVVKQRLRDHGNTFELHPVWEGQRARAAYCLSTFMNGLLADGTETED